MSVHYSDWEFVVIGEGNKGCTAVTCMIGGKNNISRVSHNETSYWISDLLFGCGMTIFKDTEEGKELTKMIKENKKSKTIYRYLNSLLIQRLSIVDIEEGIKRERDDAYDNGREDAKADIRRALGIVRVR
jgi:hypothetical protein